jgi:hypothetical protein
MLYTVFSSSRIRRSSLETTLLLVLGSAFSAHAFGQTAELTSPKPSQSLQVLDQHAANEQHHRFSGMIRSLNSEGHSACKSLECTAAVSALEPIAAQIDALGKSASEAEADATVERSIPAVFAAGDAIILDSQAGDDFKDPDAEEILHSYYQLRDSYTSGAPASATPADAGRRPAAGSDAITRLQPAIVSPEPDKSSDGKGCRCAGHYAAAESVIAAGAGFSQTKCYAYATSGHPYVSAACYAWVSAAAGVASAAAYNKYCGGTGACAF